MGSPTETNYAACVLMSVHIGSHIYIYIFIIENEGRVCCEMGRLQLSLYRSAQAHFQ